MKKFFIILSCVFFINSILDSENIELDIERLGENDSAEEAIAASLKADIRVVLPRLEERNNGTFVVIDEDAGYKTTSERIPS